MAKINARYEQIYQYETLYQAWLLVSSDERYSGDKILFADNLEGNLLKIQHALKTKTYKMKPYQKFKVLDPKERDVEAPALEDRIVQVALCLVIEVDIDMKFDHDSYSCRKGKGTLAAANRISYFMNQPSSVAYLYGDIKKCFSSMDVATCMRIIKTYYIDDEDILNLIEYIMMFENSTGVGLKIGNRWSQLAINIYLHELDRFIRVVLRCEKYDRCADDFVIIRSKTSKLADDEIKIREFLSRDMLMTLNPKSRIGLCKNGLTFVGYVIRPHSKVVKKSTLDRTRAFVKQWKDGDVNDEDFCNSMASRLGHCEGTSSYKWYCKLLMRCMRHALIERNRIREA